MLTKTTLVLELQLRPPLSRTLSQSFAEEVSKTSHNISRTEFEGSTYFFQVNQRGWHFILGKPVMMRIEQVEELEEPENTEPYPHNNLKHKAAMMSLYRWLFGP